MYSQTYLFSIRYEGRYKQALINSFVWDLRQAYRRGFSSSLSVKSGNCWHCDPPEGSPRSGPARRDNGLRSGLFARYGILAASTSMSTYRAGLLVKYLGLLGLGPTQFWFGLTYSGRESVLTRRRWALLLAPPVVILGFVVTAQALDSMCSTRGFVQGPPLATPAQGEPHLLAHCCCASTSVGTTVRHRRVFGPGGAVGPNAGVVVLLGGISPLIASVVFVFSSGRCEPRSDLGRSHLRGHRHRALSLPVSRLAAHREAHARRRNGRPRLRRRTDERLVDVNETGAALLDNEGTALGRSATEAAVLRPLPDGDDSADADVVIEPTADPGLRYQLYRRSPTRLASDRRTARLP